MASVNGNAQPTGSTPALQTFAAQSSWIAAFEYDQANLRLTTHLKNGSIYQHAFVLPAEWTALTTSQNHAKFWGENIKGKKSSIKIKVRKSPNSGIRLGDKSK